MGLELLPRDVEGRACRGRNGCFQINVETLGHLEKKGQMMGNLRPEQDEIKPDRS